LNNRLSKWADLYGVYVVAQAGFRTKMGTVNNRFVLHGLITHMINQGRQHFVHLLISPKFLIML
jgi:hypothetical protein